MSDVGNGLLIGRWIDGRLFLPTPIKVGIYSRGGEMNGLMAEEDEAEKNRCAWPKRGRG